ncbi:hypothetical protein [Francisella orientalis]|uniref:hypothetical protein n=1 Tax=Francisella orientalis TaxID=299583 RepID=UPI00214BDD92|nr:hypothetical protein [Francisella orientalis]
MKNNLSTLLICLNSLMALMLTACTSHTEKLAELQKKSATNTAADCGPPRGNS